MPKALDLTGQIFNRLTVIKALDKRNASGGIMWECLCECGKISIVRSDSLKGKITKSCGCLVKEAVSHGMQTKERIESRTVPREYVIWNHVKERIRCHPLYQHLSICPTWKVSYESFIKDMGQSPTAKHQIDRIDNLQGYYPWNCRWATPRENCRNKRNNRMIEWRGETYCASEWCEHLDPSLRITIGTISSRLKCGWEVERIMTTPVHHYNRKPQI